MSVIWHKVWRDLWHNKFRTALIVLATAVGVFALGFVYGTSGVMRTRMTESHRASRFPHITFYTSRFDREVVETIHREPGVADAEGETLAGIRWKLEGPARTIARRGCRTTNRREPSHRGPGYQDVHRRDCGTREADVGPRRGGHRRQRQHLGG